MDQGVEREAVREFHTQYTCANCGFGCGATVHGLGQGFATARWGLWEARAIRRAEQDAHEDTERNAAFVLAATPCPGCGAQGKRGLLIALGLTCVVVGLAAAALALLYTPRMIGVGIATITAVAVACVLRFQLWASWEDAKQRVVFHDRPPGTQTIRVPATLKPHASMGPTLMLAFGTLALGFCFFQLSFLLQTTPLELPCERASLEDLPPDTWVLLDACELNYAGFQTERIDDRGYVYVPLVAPGSPQTVAWTKQSKDDPEDFDVEGAERHQRFTPPGGILSDEVRHRARVFDSDHPSWPFAGFLGAGGVLLLALAGWYWPRRRWSLITV